VEVLSFTATLAAVPEFAAATGERVARLARVRHTMYARVRKIERPAPDVLLLYSDHVPGWRLSNVLTDVARERWTLDISTVLGLLRQLLPAVALFSRHQREAAIGTIGPERLILTPQGRLVLAEYVLAPGLEKAQFSRDRLWREFRVAMPPTASLSRVPPKADVVGIGIVALSLLLGRLLEDDEYLVSLGDLFDAVTETANGTTTPLSETFRTWLARALQFDAQASFQTTQEAQVAFEEMLAKERSYVTSAAQLNQFVANYERLAGGPSTAAAVAPRSAADGPTAGRPAAPVAPLAHTSRPVGATVAPVARVAPTSAPDGATTGSPAAPFAPMAPVAPVESLAPLAPVAPVERVPPSAPAADGPPPPASWRKNAVSGLAAVALLEAVAIAWLISGGGPALSDRGELVIKSRPVAARVTIDGEERGVTPYSTELSAGSHVLEVRVGRSEPRVIPLMIRPGVQTDLYIELQSVATVGGLEVRTDPPGAQVTVGGQDRGRTPLVLRDLPPGEVDVVVRLGARAVLQTVRIEPGLTSQLVVPLGR
jgi:hypothetical protein